MKTYICSKCGRLRIGNTDITSKKIICWACCLKKASNYKVSDEIKNKMSESLKKIFVKIRDKAVYKTKDKELANSIAWDFVKENGKQNKNGKWVKKRGKKFWEWDRKKIRDFVKQKIKEEGD